MKKIFWVLIVGVVLAMAIPALAAADFGITLVINGKDITPSMNVPPQIIEGYTMVPARYVAEGLGATVEWDDASRTVSITGPESGQAAIAPEVPNWLINTGVYMEEDNDLILIDSRAESSMTELLTKHFEALYYADEEAFKATTIVALGETFGNIIAFGELEKYYKAQVRAIFATDDILEVNEHGGRYKYYMPVVVWVQKTPASEVELKMYFVGIEKRAGNWYVTDWD